MKKRIVLFAVNTILVSWMTAVLAAPFNQPVPKQEFQDSTTPSQAIPSSTLSTPDNAEASSASKQARQHNDQVVKLNNNAVKMLQAELTQLNQNNLLFQQKTNARMLDLTNQNQMLDQRVTQLQQALSLLDQEVSTLSKSLAKPANDLSNNSIQTATGSVSAAKPITVWAQFKIWEKRMGPFASSVIMVAAALIVMLIAWAVWPTKKISPKTTSPVADDDDDDTKQEYDYLGSNEGIPAKLNLAEAYIAMEDFNSAKQVIDDVMKNGNDDQRAQAEALSKQIPKIV